MFAVDEDTAEAIRRAFNEDGEFSAVVELRRHYPAITDNIKARLCVRIIAGWRPVPMPKRGGVRCGTELRGQPRHCRCKPPLWIRPQRDTRRPLTLLVRKAPHGGKHAGERIWRGSLGSRSRR
jgi:hypothetical protein